AFSALGKQRQEEMKSLIQNDLQLGEKLQITEASNFSRNNLRRHQNNNVCLMPLSYCLFLSTSYNKLHQISIKNFGYTRGKDRRIRYKLF
ncbi:MAG: hypothetical protein IJM95_07805, partial [Anaerotignum sp.]|nr:hypothetical protein [Anaerotignum sp.]